MYVLVETRRKMDELLLSVEVGIIVFSIVMVVLCLRGLADLRAKIERAERSHRLNAQAMEAMEKKWGKCGKPD
jgi:hypothetical protein